MSANNNDTTKAWAGVAKGEPVVRMDVPLKQWDEDSVEMEVTHCGVCGSDIHTLNESWGPNHYPICVGHEIVGKVTRVGKNVTTLKIGDRAGVGGQSGSCHKCDNCLSGHEALCIDKPVYTYSSQWPCGTWSSGGYADVWRGDYRFAFKIPDELPSEVAATFFCAGTTTYTPLKRTNVGPGSIVGVMGIGGLGHYGILWAKAMGAKVVGMSHSEKKHDVAMELGSDDYIVTSDENDMARYKRKMTHILCTGTSPDFKWETYLGLLAVDGYFINVSNPDWNFPELNPMTLLMNQVFIYGSLIGSPNEIREMLEFAAKKNVRPWIEVRPMKDINKVHQDFNAGKPRFRYVLEN